MRYRKALLLGIATPWVIYAVHEGISALMRIHDWRPLDASAWASWVQAVGSIGAIWGAVWIMDAQQKDTARREVANERATLRNVLRAFKAEIDVHLTPIRQIAFVEPNAIMGNLEVSFPVYHACASSLGLIDNDTLRNDIVNIYSLIQSVYTIAEARNFAMRRLMQAAAPTLDLVNETAETGRAMHETAHLALHHVPLVSEKLENAARLLDNSIRHG